MDILFISRETGTEPSSCFHVRRSVTQNAIVCLLNHQQRAEEQEHLEGMAVAAAVEKTLEYTVEILEAAFLFTSAS
jgi:hypothetical protein